MGTLTVTATVTDSSGNVGSATTSASITGSPAVTLKTIGDHVILVAGSGESQAVKDQCDLVCDGTADEVQINEALSRISVEAIGKGTNGGAVKLIGREFALSSPILGRTQSKLKTEYGEMATWLRPKNWQTAFTGDEHGILELATQNTQFFSYSGFAIDGAGANVCGIYINVGTGQEYDAYIKGREVYVQNTGQHGIRWENESGGRLRGCMTSDVRVINAGKSGAYINCPDSFWVNVDCGSSGSHGFDVQHSNGHFSNCKSWFSNGHGFNQAVGRDNAFSNCGAQDNLNNGFDVKGPGNLFSGCAADSNGYNGSKTNVVTGLGVGWRVASNGNNIQGSAFDKNESNRGPRQMKALQTVGAIHLIARLTARGNVGDSDFSSATSDSDIKIVSY
jgi:hypothetical protein